MWPMSRPPRTANPAAPETPAKPRLVFTPDSGAAPEPRSRKGLALVAIILGSSLAFIDGSIVGVALPTIQGDL